MRLNIEKYIDKIFGNWTVMSFSRRIRSMQLWNCKCKCGIEKEVVASTLINGHSIGCRSCSQYTNRGSNHPNWKGGKFIPGYILKNYKHNAKRRDIYFNLTVIDLEDQWNKQVGRCRFTNTILTLPKTNADRNFNASLDRIDSSVGYILGNIQWVLKEINIMKMDLPEQRFIELCKLVTQKGGTCGV